MLELRVGLSSARLGELRLLCGRRPVWADAMANPSCLLRAEAGVRLCGCYVDRVLVGIVMVKYSRQPIQAHEAGSQVQHSSV